MLGVHTALPRRVGTRRAVSRAAQAVERHPALGVGREQLLHDGRGGRVDLDGGRVAGALRVQPVPVGGAGPGQQLPGAQPGQPPAAHPVGDEGALVLGHRAPDLEHQLLVRVVPRRPVDEHHRHAAALSSSSTTIWCT